MSTTAMLTTNMMVTAALASANTTNLNATAAVVDRCAPPPVIPLTAAQAQDGLFFCIAVVVCAALGAYHLREDWFMGAILGVVWGGIFAMVCWLLGVVWDLMKIAQWV